jgi:hypothetical protein
MKLVDTIQVPPSPQESSFLQRVPSHTFHATRASNLQSLISSPDVYKNSCPWGPVLMG